MRLHIKEDYEDNITLQAFKNELTKIYHKYFPYSLIKIERSKSRSGKIKGITCENIRCYLGNTESDSDLFKLMFDVTNMSGISNNTEMPNFISLQLVVGAILVKDNNREHWEEVLKRSVNGSVEEILKAFETNIKKIRTSLIKFYKNNQVLDTYVDDVEKLLR